MKKGCLIIVVLFVVVGLIGTLTSDKPTVSPARDTTPQTAADTARADAERAHMTFGKVYHTVDGAPACLTTDLYQEMWEYYEKKDNGALTQMIQEGQCILLKPNLTVEVTDKYFKTPHLNEVRVVGTRQKLVLHPSIAIREFTKPTK